MFQLAKQSIGLDAPTRYLVDYFDHLGARGPIGISFLFTGAPIDIFLEVDTGPWLIEKVGFDIDAAIATRYWF